MEICFLLLIMFSRCATVSKLQGVALNLSSCTDHKHLQVKKEGCQQFEEIWKNRESNLKDNPGFVRFALLKGDEEGMQSEVGCAFCSCFGCS